MEALPCSRTVLAFMGIQVDPVISKTTCYWNHLIRTIVILTMTCLISSPLYSILFLQPVLVTCTATISIYSLRLVTYFLLFSRTRRLFLVLSTTMQRLDKTAILKIKRYDRWNIIGKGVIVLILFNLILVSVMMYGLGAETTAIIMGYQNKVEEDRSFVLLPMMMFFILYLFVQHDGSVLHRNPVCHGPSRKAYSTPIHSVQTFDNN